MTIILAIDPGKLTGIALVQYDELNNTATLQWSGEYEFYDACNTINSVISNYVELDVVVERFIITPQTGRNSQAPWSLEVIGVARWLLGSYRPDTELIMQTPQRAKSFADNPRLRALGMWHKGGKGHANDALRHAVVHLIDLGWRPAELLPK